MSNGRNPSFILFEIKRQIHDSKSYFAFTCHRKSDKSTLKIPTNPGNDSKSFFTEVGKSAVGNPTLKIPTNPGIDSSKSQKRMVGYEVNKI